MKKLVFLIFILLISSVIIILSAIIIDNLRYFVSNDRLEREYRLPFKLKFDYWGFDVSTNNYGLVVCDEDNGLVLYNGKKNSTGTYIETLDTYYLGQNVLVFRIKTSQGRMEYLRVDSARQIETIDQSVFDNFLLTSRKPIVKNEELISWLKFKGRPYPNLFVCTFILLLLLALDYKMILLVLKKA